MNKMKSSVWIFHGTGGQFASGVFETLEKAEEWISNNKLNGMLTEYPIDVGCYDWAISNGGFEAKNHLQTQSNFIGKFTSASQDHYHYEDGSKD